MTNIQPTVSEGSVRFAIVDSPIGPLTIVDEGRGLSAIHFSRGGRPTDPPPDAIADPRHLSPVIEQLDQYFRGIRKHFELETAPEGTQFQLEVWNELRSIPFAETRTYGEIARALGKPGACRAVGAANGRNPIPIITPCHRVIGADGSLTGFGGGLEAKRWLLDHELRIAHGEQETLFD